MVPRTAPPNASSESDPRTVFVRSLDPSVTDTVLSTHFSSIGPVTHAFTVKKRGASSALNRDQHKGFGFVQFALEEDAVRAVQEMHGTRLEGRVMKVEGAKKREGFEVRKERVKREREAREGAAVGAGEDASGAEATERTEATDATDATDATKMATKSKKKQDRKSNTKKDQEDPSSSSSKHKLVRTVAIANLKPEDVPGVIQLASKLRVSEAVNVAKGKRGSEVREKEFVVEASPSGVVYPVEASVVRQYRLGQDGCSGEVVFVEYGSVKDALRAVRALHGKQVEVGGDGALAVGKTKKKGKGKGNDSQKRIVTLWARQVSGDGLYLKKHRVVVRNLPFDATEGDVRGVFEGTGVGVWEVTLPRGVGGEGRGFAFVGFVCRQDAERAIGKVNGMEVKGRVVAVDWAVSKREFEEGISGKEERNQEGKREGGQEGEHPRAKPGQELEIGSEEEIDLDEEKSRMNNVLEGILGGGDDDYFEEIEDDESGSQGGTTTTGDSSSSSDEDPEGDEGDKGDEKDDEADSGDATDESDASGSASDLDDTADHDNVDDTNKVVSKLNATADLLATSLSNHKAKEKEPYTVEPGATVFIRNVPIDATQKTVFEAMKKFGFVKSTRLVLNKQTSRPKGTAFVDFRSAVDAEAAAAASQQATAKTGPPVLIAGKPVEIHIALGTDDIRDLAVRKSKGLSGLSPASASQGRNLYLAQEGRIAENSSAWNALSNSDKEKRARAANESEMKLKSPNFAVSKTRLNVRNVPKHWDDRKLKELFVKAVKARATKENPKIVQVKILTNPSGGSKGIAFIEFKQHDHALCALRELNNNPDTWSKDHRPIVEFAIDNVQALKKRSMNMVKQMDSKNQASDKAPNPKKAKKTPKSPDDVDAPKSKRKLRMERRQMLKQKNRNANNPNASEKAEKKKTNGEEKAAPAPTLGKSARRREQRRKREQDVAVDGLAKTGAVPVEKKAAKRRKQDTSLEARVEAKIARATRATSAQTKKKSEARWFD